MSKYFKAKITENVPLSNRFGLLNISPLSDIGAPFPGQFYMLQAGDTYDPLLKRPFSIFRYGGNSLGFLYKIRGKGTLSLSHLRSGDLISVIGPLGNGYPEPREDFIAIAGGIGVASLLPLMERFGERAYLFYGARSREELIMLNEARLLSKEVFIATDDGSEGQKGLVTELLRDFLNSKLRTQNSKLIYACGPSPMIKELSHTITERGSRCYVSLEEHMACGVGACLGCVVKTTSGYKRVCKEGPVFDLWEIVWSNGEME